MKKNLVSLFLIVAVAMPIMALGTVLPEPDTCGETYTYTFYSSSHSWQNYGDDFSKPANVDFTNSDSDGTPDKVTVTADAGFEITKVELSVSYDYISDFVNYPLPVTNLDPAGKTIDAVKVTVKKVCPDVCLNIEGDQYEAPKGYVIKNINDQLNQCVPEFVDVTLCKTDDAQEPNFLSGWTLTLDGESDYQGVTGENGCYTFDNIPYGNYTAGEVSQTNWNQVSLPNVNGTIQAYAEQNGPYYIVNHYTPPVSTTANLVATKVVCDAEQYLPNWGDGLDEVDITSTTALNWVEESDGKCHLESGWQFEFTNDPEAITGWTEFNNLTDNDGVTSQSIPAGGTVWVREVLKPGYINFSDDTNGEDGWNEVSAEMYCGVDVLNYDNLDYISGPQGDTTYYCVAFNALEVQQCVDEPNGSWADGVVNSDQGNRKNNTPVLPARSNPSDALGASDWNSGDGDGFFSLGFGGWIVVSFDSYVPDVDGDDISIHEATNGIYPAETANVEVSQDGITWYPIGVANNSALDKVTYLDFESTGLAWIKYVRVTDTSNPALHTNDADGFDLDAVDVTEQVCEAPEEPLVCDPKENLLENGGFEAPALSPGTWDIIPDTNPLLKWLVAWANPETDGRLGLEIQNNVAGSPFAGNQHAELDGDHPVTIWQNIPTIEGQEYELSFKYSPRPGRNLADDSIQVKVDGSTLGADVATDGSANGNTVWESITRSFTAGGALTKVEFYDNGTDTSFGGYLDDVSLNCVECEKDVTIVVVSDKTNKVGDGNAVETYEHEAWVDEFGSAKWIWDTDLVTDPAVDQQRVFTKTFNLTGEVLSAEIKIAADNGFILKVNGQLVDDNITESNFGSLLNYNVASMLYEGSNTIEVTVKNFALNVSPQDNPAGVIYELTINTNECEDGVPPPPVCPLGQHLVENECVPNPQCSDAVDNADQEDSLVDANDPGCHTDGDVNNGNSYNPNDNDESNESYVCSDGLDNDDDGKVDSEDPACHSDGNPEDPKTWTPQGDSEEEEIKIEEVTVCSDGEDNDGDNIADYPNDEGCESSDDNSEDNRRILGGGGVIGSSGGLVLGATTDLCNWDSSYLRKGWRGNNPLDVKKVQNDLLNNHEGNNLTVDGVFGSKTEEAVKAFQAKYADDILNPWGINAPTGLFYLSSLKKAQELLCPDNEGPLPTLINWSENPALN